MTCQWERDLGDAILIPITKEYEARRSMVWQEPNWEVQKNCCRGANFAIALYFARYQASQNIALLTRTASQYDSKHEAKWKDKTGSPSTRVGSSSSIRKSRCSKGDIAHKERDVRPHCSNSGVQWSRWAPRALSRCLRSHIH
jgi:hypothetical protein